VDAFLGLKSLFASAFISATLAPGGSEAVLAYLVVQHQIQVELLVLVATLGNTLGAMTTWALGVLAARKFPAPTLLPPKSQRALTVIKAKGLWVLLFSWLPVIGDVLCFAAGWLKCPWLLGTVLILIGKMGRYSAIAWMLS
jgi:membrane protein YqaA with SNARE-associated domain